MKKLRRPAHFALLPMLALLSACASIPPASLERETPDLATVTKDALQLAQTYGKEEILVVFDLDNTLLAMEQGLGSDQWYDWQKALAEEDPCGSQTVPDRFAVQGAMYFASAMRPTQADAARQVRAIQDAGLRVIALTSRGADYRLQTFRELRRNGYDFRRSALPPPAGWAENFTPGRGSRPARYEDGVFLTAGQHKGDMLLELLERTRAEFPAIVIMVDDKRKNLDAVIETMETAGIVVRAWRYSGEDDQVASFDARIADSQWQAIEPALLTLQRQLGTDNFTLPDAPRPDCEP